jgi:hypothetical protein
MVELGMIKVLSWCVENHVEPIGHLSGVTLLFSSAYGIAYGITYGMVANKEDVDLIHTVSGLISIIVLCIVLFIKATSAGEWSDVYYPGIYTFVVHSLSFFVGIPSVYILLTRFLVDTFPYNVIFTFVISAPGILQVCGHALWLKYTILKEMENSMYMADILKH